MTRTTALGILAAALLLASMFAPLFGAVGTGGTNAGTGNNEQPTRTRARHGA